MVTFLSAEPSRAHPRWPVANRSRPRSAAQNPLWPLPSHFKWKGPTLSPEWRQRPSSRHHCPAPKGILAAEQQVTGKEPWILAVAGILDTGARVAEAAAVANHS